MHDSRRRFFWILIFCCFCMILQGCDPLDKTAKAQTEVTRPVYKIGLIPESNLFAQKKRYEPLLAYLSDELGVNFEIHILTRYGNIIDNFNELGLDGAFMGSFTGSIAITKLGVEPIARPQHRGGTSTYYGIVFVKKGGGIHSAEDMRGKRMVFVDRATTAGYLLPLAYFKSLGITDYTTWFREFYFSGTHEDAILDVLNGLADIGAAKSTIFYDMASTNKQMLEELEILATSPQVPSNGLVVRKGFPLELKTLLQKKLLVAHESDKGRKVLETLQVEKFIETSAKDYQPVLDYAQSVGLDLATYKYQNN